jgi:hypothetical protein
VDPPEYTEAMASWGGGDGGAPLPAGARPQPPQAGVAGVQRRQIRDR